MGLHLMFVLQCILWNTETAEPINIIEVHNDTIFSISWNRDGSLFATTSKDKKIRVIDPREGTVISVRGRFEQLHHQDIVTARQRNSDIWFYFCSFQEGTGHPGSKASKIVFTGKNRLFTTGFSRMSERQYGVWDCVSFVCFIIAHFQIQHRKETCQSV